MPNKKKERYSFLFCVVCHCAFDQPTNQPKTLYCIVCSERDNIISAIWILGLLKKHHSTLSFFFLFKTTIKSLVDCVVACTMANKRPSMFRRMLFVPTLPIHPWIRHPNPNPLMVWTDVSSPRAPQWVLPHPRHAPQSCPFQAFPC